MQIEELRIYRNLLKQPLFTDMNSLLSAVKDGGFTGEMPDRRSFAAKLAGDLMAFAAAYGFSGNLWHACLAFLLAEDENAWSLSKELRRDPVSDTLDQAVLSDFELLSSLFHSDIGVIDQVLQIDCFVMLKDYVNRTSHESLTLPMREALRDLATDLEETSDAEEFRDRVAEFYKTYGVGMFGLHNAFRVSSDAGKAELLPIRHIAQIRLDDLVGYELQKQKLRENTEAFLKGRAANNCLLFGPAGTGKSSSIKGILNEYAGSGLRIVELFRHQIRLLPEITELLRNRRYRFIIYMDDLSFEDFETDYKYLKAVIEGGLESRPENVLIYATSNRRHLIRESFKDREEGENDLHRNDTVQEKLSLAYRFGVSIYFGSPDKKEFNHIVKELAARYNIRMNEQTLLLKANQWELSHGGLSGRTAQAFIDYLRGSEG
ncbi:MAG: ATP-binding protein [Lachnospiraceae bacterium]|nr:ATP-binding protein [Lachnospiraceae bacterium]